MVVVSHYERLCLYYWICIKPIKLDVANILQTVCMVVVFKSATSFVKLRLFFYFFKRNLTITEKVYLTSASLLRCFMISLEKIWDAIATFQTNSVNFNLKNLWALWMLKIYSAVICKYACKSQQYCQQLELSKRTTVLYEKYSARRSSWFFSLRFR